MRILLYMSGLVFLGSLYACSNSAGIHQGNIPATAADSIPLDAIHETAEDIQEASRNLYENEEFVYSCSYVPSFRFIREQDAEGTNLEDIRSEYASRSSFLLELKVKKYHDEMLKYGIQSVNDYYSRIEYYSFHAAPDIRLITDSDTVSASQCHFERTYGLAPTIRLSVQFPVPEEQLNGNSAVRIQFFDRIYHQGIVNFKLLPELIHNYKVFKPKSHETN